MKRKFTIIASLAFAAGCLTAIAAMPAAHAQMNTQGVEVITNGPQRSPGDGQAGWSATRNVRDSERYESVVRSNRTFRAGRERKECGPIDDPRLHADCIASFGR
jgi:hypothetical protein